MNFEYGTQGATLDFPNPYRIENQFLAIRGLALIVFGTVIFLMARSSGNEIAVDRVGTTHAVLLMLLGAGFVLVLHGIYELARAGLQLRVFFGRGQPASLAPVLAHDGYGSTPRAQFLIEEVRQGAINLDVPQGVLNGVLYSLVRNLVTAHGHLRRYLETRFANLIAIVGLLLLFVVTVVVTPNPGARALAAAVYVLLSGSVIIRTYLQRGAGGIVALSPAWLVVLLAFGLVGTVLLSRLSIPSPASASLEALAMPRIASILLLCSAAVELLGFVAGVAHIDAPQPVSTAHDQIAVSFNADPNLLMQQVEREMQTRWEQNIPNRAYVRIAPVIEPNRQAGNFRGTLLQETQPMPPTAVRKIDWSTCLAFPRFYWLAVIDLFGTIATIIACVMWIMTGSALVAGAGFSWSIVSIGFILLVVGLHAVRSAHLMWGRLDFQSTLTWVEFTGSFARANVGLGAQFTDRVRTDREVISVESMTLQAWVVTLRTVIFDYRTEDIGARKILGMAGDLDAARAWTRQVRDFAHAQSSVVVPQTGEDARRLAQLRGANALVASEGRPVTVEALRDHLTPGVPTDANSPAVAADDGFCSACGARRQPGSRFCAQCGHALIA